LNSILKPDIKDAFEFIDDNYVFKPDKTVLIIIGNCMIDYQGRAKSLLDWGERILILKQDGTVLVHRPIMREPVNWQPSDTKTKFKIEKDKLMVNSFHKNPNEKMKIIFKKVKSIQSVSLIDKGKLLISGMEIDVVNDIVKNPKMIEEGLRICKREKQVKSGLIDLFGYDKENIPVVIEVKRSQATISSVHQLRMYVNDLKKDIDDVKIRGILCAPHIPVMIKNLLKDYDLEWNVVERKMVLPYDNQKTLKEFK